MSQTKSTFIFCSLLLCIPAIGSSFLPQDRPTGDQQLELFDDAPQLPLALQLQSSSYQQQVSQPQIDSQAPVITPFAFNQNIYENQRLSILCAISSGELPVAISWLRDGQLLTPSVAQVRKITIKPDLDQSTLKFASVKLEHAANYTCLAKNSAGVSAHSANLVVHAEPRWVRESQNEPIVASRGQTVVIDCQATGWPKPQQSWQIKTRSQSDFEPLVASPRISLASNGSLVIRNADKSDEANYLCTSHNGIGKGISKCTSLKVTVPAHFESPRQRTSVVKKQSKVQLRCDAHGDEPLTIEWYKNKQRLTNTNDADPRYSIHNNPLQNGLISLLLIEQVQRQDNSLFECVTKNPVGRDRLPIELIVQEEPDSIQEIQATQINSRSVTLMWTEPYDGRSQITSYMFQYKKLHDSASIITPTNPNNQIQSSNSMGDYDFMDSSVDVMSSSPNAAAAVVSVPNAVSTGSSPGGRQLVAGGSLVSATSNTPADDWQSANRLTVTVQLNATNGPVKSITIEKLDPSSRYLLRALAVNSIGQSKFSQPMEFTTQEEAPEVGPTNIKAIAINSTSIQVSWDEIPKSKQLGRVHGYYIGYRVFSNTSGSGAQNFIYKPYVISDLTHNQQHEPSHQMASNYQLQNQRLETVIQELRRDTSYEITVVAFNSRGSGPSSDFVVCKTTEMEAPKPVKLKIRRESNESIFIEWQRDPMDQNPVDDYVLYQEKNSASQEWLQMRLPGNQTQYKAPGLKCGTRYQFYIIAHNKVGKSLPSEVVGGSTSGALPVIPTKMSLIKMLNSTCLLVNLNAFQDNGCRIKTFTVRYRIEKTSTSASMANTHGPTILASTSQQSQQSNSGSQSQVSAAASLSSQSASGPILSLSGSSGTNSIAIASPLVATSSTLVRSNGYPMAAALTAANQLESSKTGVTGSSVAAIAGSTSASNSISSSNTNNGLNSEWITIRPKSNAKHQRANDEDRMEYLCDLDPEGEYTIHVAASNDVGRSEIEYTVLMSSDELRYSALKELLELLSGMHNLFAYIPSIIVFLMAGFFVSLVSLILYTTAIRYYQKFVIMQNQIRATRRAKQDEKRRRKFNTSRHSQKIDLWADDYEEDEEENHSEEIDDDEDADDDDSSAGTGSTGMRRNSQYLNRPNGHYLTNISSSAFDTPSMDGCNKYGADSCVSTASADSIHGRFHCLNSKQNVKMNEYSMLPTISNSLSPPSDIYGTTASASTATSTPTDKSVLPVTGRQDGTQARSLNGNPANSMYYSTLRRTNMQTYLPQQQQQQRSLQVPQMSLQQHHQHAITNQNMSDIYGYYMAPGATNSMVASNSQAQHQAANEAANSIYVPPQQIIYSAPNIRRQPIFL